MTTTQLSGRCLVVFLFPLFFFLLSALAAAMRHQGLRTREALKPERVKTESKTQPETMTDAPPSELQCLQ